MPSVSEQFVARPATDRDWPGIWSVLEPSIRDGNWFPIPRDFTAEQTRAFWHANGHHVFVGASDKGEIVWTYYTCPIHLGGGSHVANAAYAVSQLRFGLGLGHAMVEHSLETARAAGYRAMIYTAVLSTNERALRVYAKSGFKTLTRIPDAYFHPSLGYIDTLVMHRVL
jgi:GNAT superfamily N-acetyltransferase